MSQLLPARRTMALSAYAYDLGVPLPEFLLRLQLCTADAAPRHIAAGEVRLDDVVLGDPALVLTRARLPAGAVVSLGEQQVSITYWSDDNGLR
ncbi:hypothetical protein [Chitinilyticum piscinae]|uniref:Uncharacterized protein n=1 Tax=Chitinilyticum piscinae TaxID=2866724 RepID=A0A8J7FF66_9NEIS|nr:hypothetical protein [Chitinilyticum piscinae]MBE9607915.1 hypothetical protein [Chitinilyticum piscinae]